MNQVSHRTALASLWLVAGRLIARSIDLVGLVILARLLGPAVFGVIAIAMSLILIMEAILELPVSQVLLVEPEVTGSMFDTAFTLSILRGLVLAVMVWLAAWPFAALYDDPRLLPIIAVLALAPAIRGVQSPRLAIYSRELDFRRQVAMDVASKTAALLVATSIAYWTGSYWALVCGTVASPLTATILSFALAPFRPRLGLADWRLFRGFLGWLSAGQIFTAISWQMDRLVLGMVTTSASLGRFTMADNLAALPGQIFLVPIIGPLSAALVTVRDDKPRLAQAYAKLLGAIALVGVPILVGVALLAGPIVALCLGDSWRDTKPILQWLALAWIPSLIWAPFSALVQAARRPRMIFERQLMDFVVKVSLLIALGSLFLIPGVSLARGVAGIVIACLCLRDARKIVDITLVEQWRAIARPMAGSAAMAAIVYPLVVRLPDQASFAALLGYGAGLAMLGFGVYVVATGLMWHLAGRPDGGEKMMFSLATNLRERLVRG